MLLPFSFGIRVLAGNFLTKFCAGAHWFIATPHDFKIPEPDSFCIIFKDGTNR
jgi:hypothetical protein